LEYQGERMPKRGNKNMGQKERVEKLEQTTGDVDRVIVVTWGNGDPDELVTVAGEEMTYAEFDRRFPDRDVVELDWPL